MDDLSQDQQIEQAKAFLRRYGNLILVVLLIVSVVFAVSQFLKNKQHTQALEQAQLFQDIATHAEGLAANPNDQAKLNALMEQSRKLLEINKKSAYAVYTQLLQANVMIQKNDLKRAQSILQTIVDTQGVDAALRHVTLLRLARIDLEMGALDKAMRTVNLMTLEGFIPSQEELRGDVYMAMKKTSEAQKAYTKAYRIAQERQEPQPLLLAKLQSIGINEEAIEPPQPVNKSAVSTIQP